MIVCFLLYFLLFVLYLYFTTKTDNIFIMTLKILVRVLIFLWKWIRLIWKWIKKWVIPNIAYYVVLGGNLLYVCRIPILFLEKIDKFHNVFSLEFLKRLVSSTEFFTEAATFATLLGLLGFLDQLRENRKKEESNRYIPVRDSCCKNERSNGDDYCISTNQKTY